MGEKWAKSPEKPKVYGAGHYVVETQNVEASQHFSETQNTRASHIAQETHEA